MLQDEARAHVPLTLLDRFCRAVFAACGADAPTRMRRRVP